MTQRTEAQTLLELESLLDALPEDARRRAADWIASKYGAGPDYRSALEKAALEIAKKVQPAPTVPVMVPYPVPQPAPLPHPDIYPPWNPWGGTTITWTGTGLTTTYGGGFQQHTSCSCPACVPDKPMFATLAEWRS